MDALRGTYRRSQRAGGVSESKAPHLLDIKVVVEVDQVSSLLLLCLSSRGGRRQGLGGAVGGRGGGTSRLGGGQGGGGANRNGTEVSLSWGEGATHIRNLPLGPTALQAGVLPASTLTSAGGSLLPDWCFLLPEINTHLYT